MRTATLLLVAALSLLPAAAGVSMGCIPSCEIDAADTGYTSPVTVISSGQSLAWRSTDNAHVTQETAAGGGECFSVVSAGHETSEPVRFDLADGVLTATSYGDTYTCAFAIHAPESAVLLYHCLIHPTMRGAIVVTQ